MNGIFRRIVIASGMLLLRPSPAAAGAVDWGLVHAATMRGIDRLYNMKIDEATATKRYVQALRRLKGVLAEPDSE